MIREIHKSELNVGDIFSGSNQSNYLFKLISIDYNKYAEGEYSYMDINTKRIKINKYENLNTTLYRVEKEYKESDEGDKDCKKELHYKVRLCLPERKPLSLI